MAWDANCCVPTSYQWVWQRSGDAFAVAAERQAPDPYYTLNAFFGALRYQRADLLEALASPAAIAAARRLGLDHPAVRTNTPKSGPEFGAVIEAELRHWAALPAAVSSPAPDRDSLTVTIEVTEGSSVSGLLATVKRLDGRWVVDTLAAP